MGFFAKLMTPQTARFILALLALGFAAFGANKLMGTEKDFEPSQAAVFAIGQLFGLATMAFGYYFGSTARNDERNQTVEISNTKDKPVPTEDQGEQA